MKIGVPPMLNQNAAKKAGMAKDVRERFEYEKVELAIIRRAPTVSAPADVPPADEEPAAARANVEQPRVPAHRLKKPEPRIGSPVQRLDIAVAAAKARGRPQQRDKLRIQTGPRRR